jgi:CBS domain containing-hemolysin-like protein
MLSKQVHKGDVRASIAPKSVWNPNQPISIIQIGITSAELLLVALTAATLGVWINTELERFPLWQKRIK